MGGAAAVLTLTLAQKRVVALAGLLALLAGYYALHESLWNASTWWDVAVLTFVLIPSVFTIVFLLLPLWRAHGLLLVALACVGLAAALAWIDLDAPADFAKLAAMIAFAFWFLSYFESVLWVALVALIVPLVDSISVWRGPTRHIVTERREIFETFSFAFPIPGENNAANLGLPDLLFFALYLGACARFGLRTGWTWVAMTLSFGLTIALAVGFDVDGLPALPLLSLAFLAANADVLWRAFRRWRGATAEATRA